MKVGDSLQFYRADLPIIHGAVSKLFINRLGSNQRILREKPGCLEERHFRELFSLCYPLENRRTENIRVLLHGKVPASGMVLSWWSGFCSLVLVMLPSGYCRSLTVNLYKPYGKSAQAMKTSL